jgi:tol-pal system protein YbgF
MRTLYPVIRFVLALALVAGAGWAFAQDSRPLSLADRVARLEQQSQSGSGVDMVNQINALQAQVQTLQGQLEEAKHQLDEQKQSGKAQYSDLDSRLAKLEGRGIGAAPLTGAAAGNQGQMQDVTLGAIGAAASATPANNAAADMQNPAETARRSPALANNTPAAPADPAAEKAAYDEAFGALKDGRYAESARRFQAFTADYPNSDLSSNANYWLGESYYVTQNYRIALETFQKLLTLFPTSQKAPDALLKVGYCQYEMKDWNAAETTLNSVVQKYPNTTVASLAQGRLRALKLEGRHG